LLSDGAFTVSCVKACRLLLIDLPVPPLVATLAGVANIPPSPFPQFSDEMRQIRATLSPAVLVPCPAFATKSSAPPQRHPTTNRSNYGNLTFAEILSRLRCQICRRRPSAV